MHRRNILKGGGLALFGSGFFSRLDKVDGLQTHSGKESLGEIVKARTRGDSEKLLLGPAAGAEGPPEPAKYDRLPLDWNKQTVARFKDKLAQQDIHAFILRDQLNIIYLTGYWHTKTERPQAVFMNQDDAAPWYLYPGLDRDLVTSWWFGGGWRYFDFKHAEGAYPPEGKVLQGKTVDLFEMLLQGIKQRGVQGKKIGIDGKLYKDEIAKAKKILRVKSKLPKNWLSLAAPTPISTAPTPMPATTSSPSAPMLPTTKSALPPLSGSTINSIPTSTLPMARPITASVLRSKSVAGWDLSALTLIPTNLFSIVSSATCPCRWKATPTSAVVAARTIAPLSLRTMPEISIPTCRSFGK